jgi:hypothetical protein
MEVPGVTLAATCGLRWAVRIVMLSDPAVSRKLLSPVSASVALTINACRNTALLPLLQLIDAASYSKIR